MSPQDHANNLIQLHSIVLFFASTCSLCPLACNAGHSLNLSTPKLHPLYSDPSAWPFTSKLTQRLPSSLNWSPRENRNHISLIYHNVSLHSSWYIEKAQYTFVEGMDVWMSEQCYGKYLNVLGFFAFSSETPNELANVPSSPRSLGDWCVVWLALCHGQAPATDPQSVSLFKLPQCPVA